MDVFGNFGYGNFTIIGNHVTIFVTKGILSTAVAGYVHHCLHSSTLISLHYVNVHYRMISVMASYVTLVQ